MILHAKFEEQKGSSDSDFVHMIPVNQCALQTMLDILYSGGEKATTTFRRVDIQSSAIRFCLLSVPFSDRRSRKQWIAYLGLGRISFKTPSPEAIVPLLLRRHLSSEASTRYIRNAVAGSEGSAVIAGRYHDHRDAHYDRG
jgi:hypothetical protein